MDRLRPTILAAALLLPACAARATVVAETFTGTIQGSDTKDTDGLFGPAGADLAGRTITIRTQYNTALLPTFGKCRIGKDCTYDDSRDTPRSVLSSFTVNGVTVAYAASNAGAVFFQNDDQNRLSTETNNFSGQSTGGRGSALSVSFSKKVAFGRQLSPSNTAVPHRPDLASFFKPGDDYASENLSFVVTGASR